MKLRAFDGKKMFYQNNQVWQYGVNVWNDSWSVSIPLSSGGFLTTSYIMRFVTKCLYKEDGETHYNDIYEGDIVEVKFNKGLESYKEEIITKIGKVLYCDDSGAYKIKWLYNKHQNFLFFMDSWQSIKVIGNIYENPNIELSQGNIYK